MDDNDYICKDQDLNKCILSENIFFLLEDNIKDEMVERMAMIYAAEFGYTNSHVSIYKNDVYTITIYKDVNCINDLTLNTPEIIFGECEIKVKQKYKVNENLIVAIVDKNIDKSIQRKMISYGLYSPTSGTKLPSDDICQDDKLLILEPLSFKLKNSNIDTATFTSLISQGIDIFNLSSPFYTDVCFEYNLIDNEYFQNKDIALKDRVLVFFPNITLCDEDCEMTGINLTTFKAICECSYSKKNNKDILKDNALYQSEVGQVEEFISSTNIYVIKCYKNILGPKFFKECIGGLIIFILLIIEIICTIFYHFKGFFSIKIYIFDMANKYINFLTPKKNHKRSLKNQTRLLTKNFGIKLSSPNPTKEKKNEYDSKDFNLIKHSGGENKKQIIINSKLHKKSKQLILRKHLFLEKSQSSEKEKLKMNSNVFNDNIVNKKENKINPIILNQEKVNNLNSIKENNIKIYNFTGNISEKRPSLKENILNKSINSNSSNNINSRMDLKLNIPKEEFFEEYLKTEYDDMDFDDLIIKDKRHFCEYFLEKIIENQIIINTFFCKEPFKPKSIKILLFVLQIDLYFLINGLFYDENYVSDIFHLEKDTFSDIMNRFSGNLVYAAMVGIIISYILEFLFIEESRLKKIFKKQKENIPILKYEINKIVKDIKIRYILFIIITFLITIFTWIHISCFNIVYPHLKFEWLIFSFIIILFMQIFSSFICFLHTLLRFLSFKFKSDKIYKISYFQS